MAFADRLIIVNRYEPRDGVAAFVAAVAALARRVEAEGHPGVLSYRFFTGPDVRAVVTYASPDAWMGHHDIAFGWPEMAALHATARLAEVAIHGPYPEVMRAWPDRSGLTGAVGHSGSGVAGFDRG